MRKLPFLLLALTALSGTGLHAGAADYTFRTDPEPEFCRATGYEAQCGCAYRPGGPNRIDFEIPEIRFGTGRTDCSISPDPRPDSGPADRPQPEEIRPDLPAEVPAVKPIITGDLKEKDGSLGTLAVFRVGLSCKIYEGTGQDSMRKGAGHDPATGLWHGNAAFFGHNRGRGVDHFRALKQVRPGDTVTWRSRLGTKLYRVIYVGRIAATDFSRLNETGDDRVTMITCVADQPALRLCVQAVEIR